MRYLLLSLTLASPLALSAWSVDAERDTFIAHSSQLQLYGDTTAQVAVSFTAATDCRPTFALINLSKNGKPGEKTTGQVSMPVRLTIDGTIYADWQSAYALTNGRITILSNLLSRETLIAIARGDRLKVSLDNDPEAAVSFSLTGSTAALSEAIASCLAAQTQSHVHIP